MSYIASGIDEINCYSFQIYMSKIESSSIAKYCIDAIEDYKTIIGKIEKIIKGEENRYNDFKTKWPDFLGKDKLQIGNKSMEDILKTLDHEIELLQTDYLYTIAIINDSLNKLEKDLVDRKKELEDIENGLVENNK